MPDLRPFQRLWFLILLIVVASGVSHGAELSFPRLELATWGRMQDGDFGLFSRAHLELLLEGGERFKGRAEFSFLDDRLEESRPLSEPYDPNEVQWALQKSLRFKSIGVEIQRIFGSPLNMEYFSGSTDIFASGLDFPGLFATDNFATSVRGYEYFPQPQDIVYEGIHTLRGTGVKLYAPRLWDRFNMALYTYQDEYFPRGRYSSDIRFLFNGENLKIESFFGATYPSPPYGIYRGGLMFFYSTGLGGEFFTQIGIPRWNPDTDGYFTTDLFYLLFEPRVRINNFSIILTFFWHPQYYNQLETEEEGSLDFFVKFMYGDYQKKGVLGGIENKFGLQTRAQEGSPDDYKVEVSPFLSFVTTGAVWDFKINVQLLPFDMEDLIQAYIGIKTQL